MRRADFRQRVDAVHYRSQLLAENEFQHLVQLTHGSHERAQQAPLLAEEEAQIEARVETGGGAASHQASCHGERFQALGPRRHAHMFHHHIHAALAGDLPDLGRNILLVVIDDVVDRKSTRLNSSHLGISYAVFCLKKKNKKVRLSVKTSGSTNLSPRLARHTSR